MKNERNYLKFHEKLLFIYRTDYDPLKSFLPCFQKTRIRNVKNSGCKSIISILERIFVMMKKGKVSINIDTFLPHNLKAIPDDLRRQ